MTHAPPASPSLRGERTRAAPHDLSGAQHLLIRLTHHLPSRSDPVTALGQFTTRRAYGIGSGSQGLAQLVCQRSGHLSGCTQARRMEKLLVHLLQTGIREFALPTFPDQLSMRFRQLTCALDNAVLKRLLRCVSSASARFWAVRSRLTVAMLSGCPVRGSSTRNQSTRNGIAAPVSKWRKSISPTQRPSCVTRGHSSLLTRDTSCGITKSSTCARVASEHQRVREVRRAHPRAGRCNPKGRAERWGGHVYGPRLDADRTYHAQRYGHVGAGACLQPNKTEKIDGRQRSSVRRRLCSIDVSPSPGGRIDAYVIGAGDRADEVREATGVFRARGDLEAAVSALLLAGFDRADIDILADAETVRQRLRTTYVAREEMADVPYAPRRAFMAREDVALAVAGVGGILIYIGATLTALGVIASGGALGWATAAAAVIAAAGGIGASVITRFLERQQLEELESAALTGGLVLWVRVRSPEREERALKILREHGGEAVRIHEVDIEKRTEDLPLSSLRPDPWLSNERLGQP